MRRLLAVTGVAAAVQVGPAGTWLPSMRRALAPSLLGLGPTGSVGLTFDDGPHPEGTPAVLAALERLGWKATFFVLGEQARRHPGVLREVAASGHELALHGDAHRYLIARSPRAVWDDLRRARDTVGDLVGRAPVWWRPPYGVLSGPALVSARTLGLRPVLWSAWGRDWRAEATPETVVDDLFAGDVDGGTVLLHDSDVTSATGSWRVTAASLPLLAERVTERGLAVRSLTEHVAAASPGRR
jgi:peptidoglycan/xylan/chitin deacetylase (PgdA/CDA1 family)